MVFEIVFDGGNGASREKEAYGSFRLLSASDLLKVETIMRVSFGVGYTNNEAEYKTLIYVLEYIIDQYNAANIELHIAGDSELVRNQIGLYTVARYWELSNDETIADYEWLDAWQVKAKHLLPLRNKARELLKQFKSFTYVHIPRKEIVSILGH